MGGVRKWFSGLWGNTAFNAVDSRRRYVRDTMRRLFSPNSELSRGSRLALISRVQDGIRNQGLLHGLVERFVTEVIGTGMKPDLVVDHELVGLSIEETRRLESEIEKKFNFWCRSFCSIEGDDDFFGIQRTKYRAAKSSGDVLVNTIVVNGELKIQLIEAEQVTNPNGVHDSGNVVDGTQLNKFNQITHFFIQERHPGDDTYNGFSWRRLRAIDAKGRTRAFLQKEKRRPGQVRGLATLAVVLDNLAKLDEYSKNELEAALNCSNPSIFITSPFNGQPDDSEKEPIELYPGAIIDLAPGENVTTATPGRPNPEYSPYVKQKLLEICIPAKMPLEIFLMLFSASFSASRAAFLLWKKTVKEERSICSKTDSRIFSIWLDNEVDQGRIVIPDYDEKSKYWKTLTWTGPALGSIKELEQLKAAREKIDLRLSTRKKEAAEIGNDIREIDAVLAEESLQEKSAMPNSPQGEEDVPIDQ